MAEEPAASLQIKNLENFLKALKGKQPTIHVGVLGGTSERTNGQSNAEIGAIHEFGTATIPVRSFLRIPLIALLDKEIAASGALDKKALQDVISMKNIRPWLSKVAIIAEAIVVDAFNSGGYGTWIPSNMARKKNKQTLVETAQLRNSITSEVVG